MGLVRTILERVSRDRVIRRRLPPDLGARPLYVTPDASLSLWKLKLRSDLFDFAREFVKPGNVVWDVGANVGLFSFAAAHCAGTTGHVIALEPDLMLAGLLRRSAQMTVPASAGLEIIPAAVSDRLSICDFNIAIRGRASNFLETSTGGGQAGGVRQRVQTLTITLDWLLEQRPAPNIVKIDVEGAELAVLRGGNRLLEVVRPVFLCEVLEPSAEPAQRIFQQHNYVLYDWLNRAAGPLKRPTWNTLAIPAEAAEQSAPRKTGP